MKRNLLLTLALMLLGGVNLYAAPANGVEDIPGGKKYKKYTLTDASSDEEKRAALADKYAVIIDVTGVTATNQTLESANPNCIFIANAGTLANTQNVCVNGVIASLVLQDGYHDGYQDEYPFACPEKVSATEAQYSRTQPNMFGTLCLPFDVADTDVEYYTTNGVNGEGALMLTKLTTLPAGTPAIVYNYRHEDTHDYMLDAGVSELAAATEHSDGNGVKMVGSFVDKTIDVTLDTSNNYYGISSNQFVKATKTLNVKAFRAYLTTSASLTPLGAKLRLQIDDEETLAIQTLTSEGNAVSAIYNANGVRQQGLQKGLNIVKMQNGQNMKVYVK